MCSASSHSPAYTNPLSHLPLQLPAAQLVFTGYDNQEQPQNPDQTQRGQGQQRTIGKASAAGNSGSASEGSEDGLQEGDMSDGDSDDDSDDEQEEIDASRDGG